MPPLISSKAMPSLKESVKKFALEPLGFDDCRFGPVADKTSVKRYEKWVLAGYHADMDYLKRHLTLKEDPRRLLDGARSAIIVAKGYKNTPQKHLTSSLKVARYAAGKDYHGIILKKLNRLIAFIKTQDPSIHCYPGVDSRPIAERALALRSGIGFLGKNGMVIHPQLGSYFFLGVILTTSRFTADSPLKQTCGRCRLCIDACPTEAIFENKTIDAAKCTSYRTIERKKPLTEKEAAQSRGWLFGCDICQEICPYNHARVPLTDWKEFLPRAGIGFDPQTATGGLRAICKNSCLYRSRKRIRANFLSVKETFNK